MNEKTPKDDFFEQLNSSKTRPEDIKKSLAEIERQKLKDQLDDVKRRDKTEKTEDNKINKVDNFDDIQATDVNMNDNNIEENIQKNEEINKENGTENVQQELGDNYNKEDKETKEESKDVSNNEKPVSKPSKKNKTVEIVSPEVAESLKKKEDKPKISSKIDIDDDLDSKIIQDNREMQEEELAEKYGTSDEVDLPIEEDLVNEVKNILTESYDEDNDDLKDVSVEIVTEKKSEKSENKPNNNKATSGKTPKKNKKTIQYYGGDGENQSFKLRTAKITKILRNINVENTESIESTDIASKTAKERQDLYLKTVLPTLQPSISVVPFIISGVVITMSAFRWPDNIEILKIEDKIEELDPSSEDYIYEKNKLFIEKRRKQLDIFYNHIQTVSGFENKPSKEDLFGKIIKFPDFQQLFFAVYSASFVGSYEFNISCGTCGSDNPKMVNSKDLCYLLNDNINIKSLNHYIEKGYTFDSSESAKIYNEFQSEKLVEMSNKVYRTKEKLPVSAFLYDLKIPTIYEALDTMEEIIEVFREKDLTYTNPDTGDTVSIDSAFGLTSDLVELRNYLYIKSLIVASVVDENKEKNVAKVSFVNFSEKSAIINSIYSLTPEDYKKLINDENLRKLVRVSGIRHAINGGKCSEPTCGIDLGKIPIDPEALFFIIARRESV